MPWLSRPLRNIPVILAVVLMLFVLARRCAKLSAFFHVTLVPAFTVIVRGANVKLSGGVRLVELLHDARRRGLGAKRC